MPRSGSSMVAGIFAKHGVWAGTPYDGRTWDGEPCYENRLIKKHLIKTYGRLEMGPELDKPGGEEMPDLIKQDGYKSGPWLFKVSAMYWRAFSELRPKVITIRRPLDSIRKSVKRDNLRVNINGHAEIMDRLESEGAYRIDTPRLIDRDYSQIEIVFSCCGLKFQPEIADSFIRPKLWHS